MNSDYPIPGMLGFDCASRNEIMEALDSGGTAERIIYAQPCKTVSDIHFAQSAGVPLTVADSEEEIEKLASAGWKGSILLRLLVDDKGSKQPFGKKFGAPLEWVSCMLKLAARSGLDISGFSFHVGSECQSSIQYYRAIERCRIAADEAARHGYSIKTIDIGGGFLPSDEDFASVAQSVKKAKNDFFSDIEWIAEPGRFLAAPTYTLCVPVIGKKRAWPSPRSASDVAWRYTIDESVYGMFSNVPFDHQKPIFRATADGPTVPCILFGRTCDSGDLIADEILLPELQVGDILTVPDMGAYTTVTASEFNGFPKPQKIYLA
jgi:ornithine decarboxylase